MHEREAGLQGNKRNWLVNGNQNPGPGQKNQVQWKATDNAHIHFEKGSSRSVISAAARIYAHSLVKRKPLLGGEHVSSCSECPSDQVDGAIQTL
jgi:hypothetical protein